MGDIGTINTTLVLPNVAGIFNNTTSRTYADAEQYWQHRVSSGLWIYLSPVIIFLGVVANIISLLVMLVTKSFRQSSLGFLLAALAVVDSLVLLTPFLRQWIRYFTPQNLDVRTLTPAGCHTHMILTYFLPQLSSWTIVSVSVERMVSVLRPFAAREIFQKRRSVAVWLAIAGTLLLINLHMIWTIQFGEVRGRVTCFYGPQFTWFWVNIWRWIDCSLMSIVPCAVVIVCNALTIRALMQARRLRKRVSTDPRAQRMSSTTAMLIVVSTAFVLTTTPSVIYYIHIDYFVDMREMRWSDPLGLAKLNLAYTITSMLYYTNNAINFVLYCVSGSRFRQSLSDMVHLRVGRGSRTARATGAQSSGFVTQSTRLSRVSNAGGEVRDPYASPRSGRFKGPAMQRVTEDVGDAGCDDC